MVVQVSFRAEIKHLNLDIIHIKVSLPPEFFRHKCIEIIKIFRLHWRLRSGGQQAGDTSAIKSSPRHGR